MTKNKFMYVLSIINVISQNIEWYLVKITSDPKYVKELLVV